MLKKLLKWLAVFLTAFAAVVAALLFVPKNNGKPYRITVAKNQGISSVSRKLAQDGIVYNRYVLVAAAYVMGVHNQLNAGSYRLSAKVSAWDILKRIKKGRPDSVSVQILEGARFAQMRRIIDNTADIAHDTRGWSDEKLMAEVAPDALSSNPEGQFFPDSYEIDAGGSDLQIYKIAYRKMRENLQEAWDDRQSGLPYKNPYEMLIMASLIEKRPRTKTTVPMWPPYSSTALISACACKPTRLSFMAWVMRIRAESAKPTCNAIRLTILIRAAV